MWGRFDISHDRLPTSLDIDLTDRDLFGFFTTPIVERLNEFSSYCCSLHTVSKIEVQKLKLALEENLPPGTDTQGSRW